MAPQGQQRVAKPAVALHQVGANYNQSEHAGLGQDAAQQRTGLGPGPRVRLGQPDVQGEQARLGRKAHQGQPYRHRESGVIREGRGGCLMPAKDSVPS